MINKLHALTIGQVEMLTAIYCHLKLFGRGVGRYKLSQMLKRNDQSVIQQINRLIRFGLVVEEYRETEKLTRAVCYNCTVNGSRVLFGDIEWDVKKTTGNKRLVSELGVTNGEENPASIVQE